MPSGKAFFFAEAQRALFVNYAFKAIKSCLKCPPGRGTPRRVCLVIHFISPLPKVTQCPSGPLGDFVVVRCEMKTVFHYESAKPSHRIAFPGCSQSTDIHNRGGEASRRERKNAVMKHFLLTSFRHFAPSPPGRRTRLRPSARFDLHA